VVLDRMIKIYGLCCFKKLMPRLMALTTTFKVLLMKKGYKL